MKLFNLTCIILAVVVSTSSQDKPKEALKSLDTFTNLTILSPSTGGVSMTCAVMNSEFYDGTEIYDCKLENGHTLDGVIRVFMRLQREQAERCEAEKKAIFNGWDHTLKEFKQSIPKVMSLKLETEEL